MNSAHTGHFRFGASSADTPARLLELRRSVPVPNRPATCVFGSLNDSNSTSLPTLQRLGRWKSVETLLDTYAHVLPASGGDAVARLEQTINENDRQ